MKNLTVLHSFPIWLPQTQTWMYSQVAELQRLGVDAHVVCERTENLDQFSVDQIHCLTDEPQWRRVLDQGLRKLRWRRHLDFMVRVGKSTGATIVHSHFGNVGWANLGAVRRLGAKHVVTFYGLDVNKLPTQFPIWRKRYRQLFEEVNLILCEGSHMARCIVALGCPAHKVKVQHLGVDVEGIAFKPRQWRVDEPLRVLIAATFREKKGVPIALEMLGRLQHKVPLEITIIGEATYEEPSQIERKKILDMIAHHHLQDRVRLLGFQPHRVFFEEAYRHHLFLSPSVTASNGDTEGGAPVSIIEMAASGMPIISTTHCDIPEVMRPEAARFLAPERDPVALLIIALSMIRDWSQLEDPMNRLHDYVVREYDHKTQGQHLANIYRDIIKGPLCL